MPSTFDSVYDISYWPTHPGYLINKDIYLRDSLNATIRFREVTARDFH
jgi:hypothetical protein